MDVLLVPGFWLDASSWEGVTASLEAAGHTVHALTMPGVGVAAPDSSDIGLADWVVATVAAIDVRTGPVALVGHSGGGHAVWGAADARVDRVARVVFVDSVPLPPGGSITGFPVVDEVVPFPGWDYFPPNEVADMDAATKARWAARTRSIPRTVPTDQLSLTDERRFALPVTVITATFPENDMRDVIAAAPPWASELAALHDLEIVGIDSGHWPQFSKPRELAEKLVVALAN
ncbi:alpha/beta fold hydrolase [Microbacterium sp. P07]|uniref:alpha/beta fold hydrolase n=1 Tax=Microbacterium sp. P07 TaxID=3366952 RepID=UPI003744FBF0